MPRRRGQSRRPERARWWRGSRAAETRVGVDCRMYRREAGASGASSFVLTPRRACPDLCPSGAARRVAWARVRDVLRPRDGVAWARASAAPRYEWERWPRHRCPAGLGRGPGCRSAPAVAPPAWTRTRRQRRHCEGRGGGAPQSTAPPTAITATRVSQTHGGEAVAVWTRVPCRPRGPAAREGVDGVRRRLSSACRAGPAGLRRGRAWTSRVGAPCDRAV